MTDDLGDILKGEDPRNISTLAIVSTVVATLNDVISAMREEIAALGAVERRNRKMILVFLGVLLVAVLTSVGGVFLNYRQGDDVKSIVRYIEDCQKPDSPCKRTNDEVIAGAVKSISAGAFDSLSCVLEISPEARTDVNVRACRDRYLGTK